MRKFGSLAAIILCAVVVVVLAACKAGDGAGTGRSSVVTTSENQNAATATPNAPANAPTPPDDGVRRISVIDAHKAADEGRAVFVDVRGTVEFERGHIKDSLSIPRGQIAQFKNKLPGDKLIILYCA